MGYLKVLGLAAALSAALMGFAGGAAATTLTGPSGETTPTIHLVNENGHIGISNSIAKIECGLTLQGTVTSHGVGLTAGIGLNSLTTGPCTNSWHVTTVTPGTFEVHYLESGVGTLTWSGMTVNTTRLGVTCNFVTSGTDFGRITDTSRTGGVATVHIEALIPFHSGSSALCGSGAVKVEGKLAFTTNLFIDA